MWHTAIEALRSGARRSRKARAALEAPDPAVLRNARSADVEVLVGLLLRTAAIYHAGVRAVTNATRWRFLSFFFDLS
jgi:hypothetical protein